MTNRYTRAELIGIYKDYDVPEPLHPPLVVLFDPSVVQLSGSAQRPLCLGRAILSSTPTTPPVTTATAPVWFYVPKEGEASLGPVCLDDLSGYVDLGMLKGTVRVHLKDGSQWDLTTVLAAVEQRRAQEKAARPAPPVHHEKPKQKDFQPREGGYKGKAPANDAVATSPIKQVPERQKVPEQQQQASPTKVPFSVPFSSAESKGAQPPAPDKKSTPWRSVPATSQAPAPQVYVTQQVPPPPAPAAAPVVVAPVPAVPSASPNYVVPKQYGNAWAKPLQNAIKPSDGAALPPVGMTKTESQEFPDLNAEKTETPQRGGNNQKGGGGGRGQGASESKSRGRGGARPRGGRVDPGLLNFNLPDPNAQRSDATQ